MKFFALLATAAVLTATTKAAECTTAQVTAIKNSAEYQTMNTVDCDTAPIKGSSCDANACLNALKAVVKVLPECSIQGADLKKEFGGQLTDLQAQCEKEVSGSSNSTSSSTTKTPSVGSAKTAAPTAGAGSEYAECTEAQLAAIGSSSDKATRAACDSPLGTDPKVSSKKVCEKPCLDAWDALLASKPKCLMRGDKYWELSEQSVAQIKEGCAKFFPDAATGGSNSTATTGDLTAKATTAPSVTTKAPTANSSGPMAGVSVTVSAAAAVVVLAVVL